MKALTVMQPWATLIAEGVKTVETRGWKTDYRGPLAIHAGLKNVAGTGRDLPTGVIVATCNLHDCIPTSQATVGDVDRALGDFTPGRWAWLLTDLTAVAPVRCRGNMGLWDVPPNVQRQLTR